MGHPHVCFVSYIRASRQIQLVYLHHVTLALLCLVTLLIFCLIFKGGLQLANEQKDDSYHFLVFTDLFGNRTHGVVVQYYRAVQVLTHHTLTAG